MEWNRAFTEVLIQQYRVLAVADDGACFSRLELPVELHLATLLVIDIASQSMAMFKRGSFNSSYQVSTSSRGAGCRIDTGCTPLGWHRIKHKIGEAAPVGSVFIGRQQHGVVDELCSDKEDDLITSRILWLDGIQPGVNQGGELDSCRRYIYIHGTAQEQLIGTAVSHGCIRMRNAEIIKLFDTVEENCIVFISHNLSAAMPDDNAIFASV